MVALLVVTMMTLKVSNKFDNNDYCGEHDKEGDYVQVLIRITQNVLIWRFASWYIIAQPQNIVER